MYIVNVVKEFLENRSSCGDDDISKVLAGSNQRNIIRAEEQDDVLKLEEKTKVELGGADTHTVFNPYYTIIHP